MRMAAVLLGVVASLAPAALLAYDANVLGNEPAVVAQATPTATVKAATPTAPVKAATATASPAAPKTGGAGLASEAGTASVAALLVVLAVGVVAGGRVLASRRS
jgi:hypothetical protein